MLEFEFSTATAGIGDTGREDLPAEHGQPSLRLADRAFQVRGLPWKYGSTIVCQSPFRLIVGRWSIATNSVVGGLTEGVWLELISAHSRLFFPAD